MATLALYTFEDIYLTLSGSNITAVADQSSNGYNLAEGTSGNGGVRELTGFGGYPCVNQDGADDYLFTSSGLASAAIGGTDNSCWVAEVQQRIAVGTGGDATVAFGNSASANFFFRFVEGTAAVSEVRKRDDATSAGAGAGGTGTAWGDLRQYWEWSHPGTTTELLRTGTTGGLTTYIASTAMDVGACTSNRFAIGCLLRTSAASFMQQRVAMVHICDAAPATDELKRLRGIANKYISAPDIINSPADRARRDRHIHAKHRPVTWKKSKNGVMIPAEDTRIVQVNGFRVAA